MKILFTIGGEEHSVDRDGRLDKILITDAEGISEDRAKETPPRPPITAGERAEILVMPIFDDLLKQQDDQRKAEIAAQYDKVDEKTKIFVTAINKELVNRAVAGDTAFVQKIVDAFGIPIEPQK